MDKAKQFLKLQKQIKAIEADKRRIMSDFMKLRIHIAAILLRLETAKLKLKKTRDEL